MKGKYVKLVCLEKHQQLANLPAKGRNILILTIEVSGDPKAEAKPSQKPGEFESERAWTAMIFTKQQASTLL